MKRVTFRLPQEQLDRVEKLVESGVYFSRSELLRTAVREQLRKEAEAATTRGAETLARGLRTDGGRRTGECPECGTLTVWIGTCVTCGWSENGDEPVVEEGANQGGEPAPDDGVDSMEDGGVCQECGRHGVATRPCRDTRFGDTIQACASCVEAEDELEPVVIATDGGHDPGETGVCPVCDSHRIRPRNGRNASESIKTYRCGACGAEFDEPARRPPKNGVPEEHRYGNLSPAGRRAVEWAKRQEDEPELRTDGGIESSGSERWEPAFQCPSCGAEMRPRGRCQNQDCQNWQYTEIQRTESGVFYRFDGGGSARTDGGSEKSKQLKRARKRLSKFAERIRRNNQDLDTVSDHSAGSVGEGE